MKQSSYNVVTKISNSDKYFIVNPLYGSADILDAKDYRLFTEGGSSPELVEKGYIVNESDEKKAFTKAYLKFIDDRESDEVQIFFVTNYNCNFACSYCYQSSYEPAKEELSEGIIQAFFNYIDTKFSLRKKYITIFGGEPLLGSTKQKELISNIIGEAQKRTLDIAIVTNGYNISSYIDILISPNIREIQVTLDGTKQFHDTRRFLKGGQSTFDKIVEGIDLLIENKIPVNLRMVIDKENIGNLPDLAKYAIEKGWTKSKSFKTQLGRNYELHDCQTDRGKLYSRLELYSDIFELLQQHPEISEFHQPAFSISRFLYENGEVPTPLFDACTGTKTEWAFDFKGNIYSCTATVGKEGEELGTFYPEVTHNITAIEDWKSRDILSISKCKSCNYSLLCGGGCASMAKNYNGNIHQPDCRPIPELLSLGVSHYFNESI